jgi:hypothetical protein
MALNTIVILSPAIAARTMLSLLILLSTLSPSLALPNLSSPGKLIILDTGVGHRSHSVPQWRSSLRSISTRGQNASILEQYGPAPSPQYIDIEPIGTYDLTYSPITSSLYIAMSQGILRTDAQGTNGRLVIPSNKTYVKSIAVAERSRKLYYGTSQDGFIWRANIDGTGVEAFRNVSQGLKWGYANSWADGILVDDAEEWMYWSASRGPDDGSIRRIRTSGGGAEEVLVKGLNMPRQLRILGDTLYWCEMGRWSNSPTSLKRAKLGGAMKPEIIVHSNQSSMFFEKDYTRDLQTLGITSFVLSDEGDRLWFVMRSAIRTMFAKLVEVGLTDRKLNLLNQDTKDLGIPIAMDYVR